MFFQELWIHIRDDISSIHDDIDAYNRQQARIGIDLSVVRGLGGPEDSRLAFQTMRLEQMLCE